MSFLDMHFLNAVVFAPLAFAALVVVLPVSSTVTASETRSGSSL